MGIKLTVSAPLSGTITVQAWPSDPMAGETVYFWISAVSGFSVADPYEELDFEWDFGDPGSTYSVGGGGFGTDANRMNGWNVAHVYTGDGAKTVTVSARQHGISGTTGQSTVNFNVTALDNISWTKVYWVDFGEVSGTPDFTGATAEDSVNTHISSAAALQATSATTNSRNRYIFKKGETFTWDQASISISNALRTSVGSRTGFGTGANPQIISNRTGYDNYVFYAFSGGDDRRFSAWAIDMEGGYDPSTGTASPGTIGLVSTIYSTTQGHLNSVSAYQCVASGCVQFMNGRGGSVPTQGRVFMGWVDCDISDWSNFGAGSGANCKMAALIGSRVMQNPLAMMNDDAKPETYPQAADHGPWRLNGLERAVAFSNKLANSGGWSPALESSEIQALIRYMVDGPQYDDLVVTNTQENIGYGANFLRMGATSPASDSDTLENRCRHIVDRNKHHQGRQKVSFVDTSVSGFYIRNNMYYLANCSQYVSGLSLVFLDYPDGASQLAQFFTQPCVVSFNTTFSDLSSASGGNGTWAATSLNPNNTSYGGTVLEVGLDFNWHTEGATVPTVENNVVYVPNHSNAASFNTGPISRAELGKPVTGNAAINAVSSGTIPVRDIDGNLRGATTNAGAFDTVDAVDAGVSAPANSVAPTIAELASFPGQFSPTSFGTWTNWSDGSQYLFDITWAIGGTTVTRAVTGSPTWKQVTLIESKTNQNPLTGTLTATLTATNTSGSRVSATSPGIAA